MNHYNLLLWGTGKRTKMCLEQEFLSAHNIIGIIDTHKRGDAFCSLPVYTPDKLTELIDNVDYLLILNQYYGEILRKCWEMNIPIEKIIITDNVQGSFFSEFFSKLRNISEDLYRSMRVEEYRIMHPNLSDRVDASRLIGRGKYVSDTSMTDYMIDYFRYRTFEFVAREIKERNVSGELAELGVYKGMFASLMNETFPSKKLYLFDTFESFAQDEFAREREKGRCSDGFLDGHLDTSEELLMSHMPHPESCIVCKGLFPSSVSNAAETEQFAFVSLDVDFEESTYQGLKFFYPRLSENGYIFLHDYTTHWLQGVKIAVDRYERDNHLVLKKIPIADRGGTLIITK